MHSLYRQHMSLDPEYTRREGISGEAFGKQQHTW